MFRVFYDSAWQHPGIAFAGGVPLLLVGLFAWSASRRAQDPDPRRHAWLATFLVLELAILLDAWLTGAWSPLHGGSASIAAAVFVILGDLRFFYLVERQRGEVAPGARNALRALVVALPMSLLVPIAAEVLRRTDPTRFVGSALYVRYEVAALVVMVAYALARMPRAADGADRRRPYVLRLLGIVGAQYALWVVADVLILRGLDLGYLLRVVPNVLYYVVFVPAACLATPAGSST